MHHKQNVVLFSPLGNHQSEDRHLMLISQVKRGAMVTYSLMMGNSFFFKRLLPLWLDSHLLILVIQQNLRSLDVP